MSTTQSAPPQQGATLGAPSARLKRVRAPWLIVGGIILAIAVAGSVFLYQKLAARTEYLTVASDVQRGEVITLQHLDLAYINRDQAMVAFSPRDRDVVVGMRAIVPLTAGTLLQPGMLSDSPDIPEGHTLIGSIVGAGDFPISSVNQGDLMAMVMLPEGRISDREGKVQPVFEVARPEVYRVEERSGSSLFFTFSVPEERAALISALIRENRLRLVQVDADTPPIRFLPIDAVEMFANLTAELLATRDTTTFGNGGALYVDGLGLVILDERRLTDLDEEAEEVYLTLLATVEADPSQQLWHDQNRDGIDDDTNDALPAEVVFHYAPALVDLGIEPGDLFGAGDSFDFGAGGFEDPGYDDFDDFDEAETTED